MSTNSKNAKKKASSARTRREGAVETVILEDGKYVRFYYEVLPVILAVLACAASFIRFLLIKLDSGDVVNFKTDVSLTSFFDGNPNIVAILGCFSIFICFLVVPKSIKKTHESGDGLGAMFMPLGLLGIFTVMCTIENLKDMAIGITFGVVLFVISALATFKKTISYVMPLCLIMILVAFFLILAGLMPYCYNRIPFALQTDTHSLAVMDYYYLSYFIRDILLLLSFGIFSDRLKRTYKKMEAEK